jgi:hypothetical protein
VAVYETLGSVISEANWALSGIDIISAAARSRVKSDFVGVRVGLRVEGNTDWVGSWSQDKTALAAGTKFSVMDQDRFRSRVSEGATPVVEITTNGSPSTIVGSSVTFHIARVSGVAGKVGPLINTVAEMDPGTRSLIDQLNESGVGESSRTIQLVDPSSTVTQTAVAPYHDYDASAQAISSTSYVDSNVAITVLVPSGKTVKVMVSATCSGEGNAGAAYIHAAISDGATEVVESQAHSTGTNAWRSLTSHYAEDITADTTYKLRLKYTTTALSVKFQQISAIAVSI